jgi:hypothetical protein
MTSCSPHRLGCAALAALLLSAAAGCSNIGDGANGSRDPGGIPPADAAPGSPDAPPPDAGSGLVETLVIPTDGTVVSTSAAAASGATYRLVASGVYTWGLCDSTACPGGAACGYQRLGDAYHRTDDCWASTTTGFAYISLYVDGQQVDWGSYRSDHAYAIELPGAGAPFQLQVMDCEGCYLDNSGELSVALYRPPTE